MASAPLPSQQEQDQYAKDKDWLPWFIINEPEYAPGGMKSDAECRQFQDLWRAKAGRVADYERRFMPESLETTLPSTALVPEQTLVPTETMPPPDSWSAMPSPGSWSTTPPPPDPWSRVPSPQPWPAVPVQAALPPVPRNRHVAETRTCYKCGQPGHLRRDCPQTMPDTVANSWFTRPLYDDADRLLQYVRWLCDEQRGDTPNARREYQVLTTEGYDRRWIGSALVPLSGG